jgi:large subunit ribosomal protein L31
MKKGIHPEYKTITYVMTDGSKHEVRSTLKENEITLQVDPLSHPAYTGKRRVLDTDGRMDKFNKKYGR